jgi:hypothetical protein
VPTFPLPPPSPAAAAATPAQFADHTAASSSHAVWPAFLQHPSSSSSIGASSRSLSRRPSYLVGQTPITDLEFDLADCPVVGPECRLCYSDIYSLVSKGQPVCPLR